MMRRSLRCPRSSLMVYVVCCVFWGACWVYPEEDEDGWELGTRSGLGLAGVSDTYWLLVH